MTVLIKNRQIVANPPSPESSAQSSGTGEVLRLGPADDPASVAGRLAGAACVEIEFPKFSDGRGFSIARLLRERYGYCGELRAVGQITRDHLHALEQVGFDAFELRDGEEGEEVLAAFDDFSDSYQATCARPQPLFPEARVISTLERNLGRIASDFAPVVLASSLSAEDLVITDVIARAELPIGIFALDTGRLHADTLQMLQTIKAQYGIDVQVYTPDADAVAEYIALHGRDAFYGSLELRQRCCQIRKVEPLKRALQGQRAWITGQRREHSAERARLPEREFDLAHGIEKFNPLAAWSETDVWNYIRARRVPYNRLYDQGYRSIGCAPCTRPLLPGEELRAGRWWWELAEHKECGLHPHKTEEPHAA